MILQNFPLGSDMSPGREKPTAGSDVLAAMRGTVACCWARLHAQLKPFRLIYIYICVISYRICDNLIFPHKSLVLIGWLSQVMLNPHLFVGTIAILMISITILIDQMPCFGGKLTNFEGLISHWPRWPRDPTRSRLTRNWSTWRPIFAIIQWAHACQQKRVNANKTLGFLRILTYFNHNQSFQRYLGAQSRWCYGYNGITV